MSAIVVLSGVCFVAGRLTAVKPKVEVRTEVKVVELERIKEVHIIERAASRLVQRKTERTWTADGGVREVVVEREATVTNERDASAVDRSVVKTDGSTQTTVVTPYVPQWRLGVLVGSDYRNLDLQYGGLVSKRLLGPLWVGAFGLSGGTVGVSATLEF